MFKLFVWLVFAANWQVVPLSPPMEWTTQAACEDYAATDGKDALSLVMLERYGLQYDIDYKAIYECQAAPRGA